MSRLKILIVENEPDWQERLRSTLQALPIDLIKIVATHEQAEQAFRQDGYDLGIIDLRLPEREGEADASYERGEELLHKLYANSSNRACGCVVLTGFGTIPSALRIRDNYQAVIVEKQTFRPSPFLTSVREAILTRRLARAEEQAIKRNALAITLDEVGVIESKLTTAGFKKTVPFVHPLQLSFPELLYGTRELNPDLAKRPYPWFQAAAAVGDALYDRLASERVVLDHLSRVQPLDPGEDEPAWLQFITPASGLSLPFELIRQDEDFLALRAILFRTLRVMGLTWFRNESFSQFIRGLYKQQIPLRALIVAAYDDQNGGAEQQEAILLHDLLTKELSTLGLSAHITPLYRQEDVTYERVVNELQEGRYHLFHYVGGSYYDEQNPMRSGLALPHKHDTPLTAAKLNALLKRRQTDLRFVYLNSSYSAAPHQGAFHGMLDALVRAGISTTLGNRWRVDPSAAMEFALTFYQMLWRTLSPGEALYRTRISRPESGESLADAMWATPILVMQKP